MFAVTQTAHPHPSACVEWPLCRDCSPALGAVRPCLGFRAHVADEQFSRSLITVIVALLGRSVRDSLSLSLVYASAGRGAAKVSQVTGGQRSGP